LIVKKLLRKKSLTFLSMFAKERWKARRQLNRKHKTVCRLHGCTRVKVRRIRSSDRGASTEVQHHRSAPRALTGAAPRVRIGPAAREGRGDTVSASNAGQ
jgi:hypothetical protein